MSSNTGVSGATGMTDMSSGSDGMTLTAGGSSSGEGSTGAEPPTTGDATNGSDATTSPGTTGGVPGGTTDGTTGDEPEAPPYACPPGLTPCPAFPSANWESRDPGELGLDAGILGQFAAATSGGRGCVVRYGYLANCWGNPGEEFEWASASKPVWSTFLLFAVAEGKLATVDEPISAWGWSLSPADQTMTFRHLANQVSGYALPEAPGAAWGYNDYAIKLYGKTIFERVFVGEGNADQIAAAPGRLGLLQFQDGPFFADVKGLPRVSTTPRDYARFGWLWANHGVWNDTVLIPPALVEMALTPGVPGNLPRTAGGAVDDYLGIGTGGGGTDQTPLGPGVYAFNWWLNPGKSTWPSAPEDTIQANGHWNGEVMTVIPSLGLVAAWKGSNADANNFNGAMDQLLALLVAAAK